MGIETILATVAGGLQIGSQIAQGSAANAAAKQQANYAKADAANRGKELARQTALEANAEEEAADSALRRQKLAYLASGVTLQGSPLLVMEETRRKGAQNVDEILKSGASQGAAVIAEGRQQATAIRAQGRQAFASSIGNAGTTAISTYQKVK